MPYAVENEFERRTLHVRNKLSIGRTCSRFKIDCEKRLINVGRESWSSLDAFNLVVSSVRPLHLELIDEFALFTIFQGWCLLFLDIYFFPLQIISNWKFFPRDTWKIIFCVVDQIQIEPNK